MVTTTRPGGRLLRHTSTGGYGLLEGFLMKCLKVSSMTNMGVCPLVIGYDGSTRKLSRHEIETPALADADTTTVVMGCGMEVKESGGDYNQSGEYGNALHVKRGITCVCIGLPFGSEVSVTYL